MLVAVSRGSCSKSVDQVVALRFVNYSHKLNVAILAIDDYPSGAGSC